MLLIIQTKQNLQEYDLEVLAAARSGIITIGGCSSQVWNSISIDDPSIDPFQCQIVGVPGFWRITNGQERTECPKGLLSSKIIPCNGCMGRCVNVRAGRPRYYLRTPATPTLLNGQLIPDEGTLLEPGFIINVGEVSMTIRD